MLPWQKNVNSPFNKKSKLILMEISAQGQLTPHPPPRPSTERLEQLVDNDIQWIS